MKMPKSIYGYQLEKEMKKIELPTEAQSTASDNQGTIKRGNQDLSINPNDQTSIYGIRPKTGKKIGYEKILNEARRILFNNRKSIHHK